MQEFVEALATQGSELKRTISSTPSIAANPIPTLDLYRSVASSLFDVIALMNGNSSYEEMQSAVSIVASAAAHDLLFVKTKREDVKKAIDHFTSNIVSQLEEYNADSKSKDEAKGTSLKAALPLLAASFAARRIDTEQMREWTVSAKESSIEELTTKLSRAKLDSGDSTDNKAIFYCQMGGVIERAPSSSPFVVHSLSRREVSLRRVKAVVDAALRDLHSLKEEGFDLQKGIRIDSFGEHEDAPFNLPEGAARHPLAIQATEDPFVGIQVVVHLSEPSVDKDAKDGPDAGSSSEATTAKYSMSSDAIESLLNGTVDHRSFRERMLRARRIGFDCERFLFALQLGLHYAQTASPVINAVVRSEEHAVAFCVAKSMLDAMYPSQTVTRPTIIVDDVGRAEQALEAVKAKVTSALRRKLTHCILAEFAVCL